VIRATVDWGTRNREPFWADAHFTSPPHARGLVILAHHDLDDSQAYLRLRITEHLAAYGIASCTVGLTGHEEHVVGRMVIDVETLAERLDAIRQFMAEMDETRGLPIAIFGQDYCGAAAMAVAAARSKEIRAVGTYCGRPDLVRFCLAQIRTPTLLVVPGRDPQLLGHNERAFDLLECPSQMAVIRNATRSLSEAGAAHACRCLIRRWCENHLVRKRKTLSTR